METHSKRNIITQKEFEVSFESYVYKITDTNNLKKYYLSLQGKDIYYYKTEKKEDLQGMHNLSGCYIKEGTGQTMENIKLFCFVIDFNNKQRTYYVDDVNLQNKWIQNLKESVGYYNFYETYNMVGDLGQGKFGLVKLGLHKSTGEKVAIKIIKKASMNDSDMELVRSEIDIMKLCRHPYIVRLLDHFENSDYIFIIMEYLAGDDFGTYLEKMNYKFTEKQAATMMSQIASGIKYLHQYGIVHRDLKPENIMLSDKTDNFKLKIMDFGLSKILGPLETAVDGFGTLTFVAPEVLIRQPYNKQVDVWSLGVIMYNMITGIYPFDDDSDNNEEIIAKMIVFQDLSFPIKFFKGYSKELIELIKKCLNKNPKHRISVDQFLKDEWILNNTGK
jgi:serine/threonine protein kinase